MGYKFGIWAFSALLLSSQATLASDVRCASILNSEKLSKEQVLESLIHRFVADPDGTNLNAVLAGTRKPNWHSYRWVLDLQEAIQKHGLTTTDLAVLAPKIQRAAQLFEFNPERAKVADRMYRFLEQLRNVNELLKTDFFPAQWLELAPTDESLKARAIQIVKNNESKLRELYSTSGHKSPADLAKYIENFSKHGKRVLELVQNNLIVTIRRPEGARFWIPLTGFQNQRVTDSSEGAFHPDFRNAVESQLIGKSFEEYSGESARLQPQYGEVRPKFDILIEFKSIADRYGEDIWVLKKEVVEQRTTWTPDDSFHQPRSREKLTYWNQMVLPWSHRELMAPYLLKNAESNIFFPSYSAPENFILNNYSRGDNYVEAQIWGPVTLQDVEAFVFTKTPPEPAFVKKLQSHGIKIMDGRTGMFYPYEVSE